MSDIFNIEALADAIFEKLQPKILQAINALSPNTKQSLATTNDVMTIDEASKFLSIAKSTIYNNPDIPRMKKGKRLYFSKDALMKYLQGGKINSKEETDLQVDKFLKNSKR